MYPGCIPCGRTLTSPTATIEILVDNCPTEGYCRWIITRPYDDYAEFKFQLHDLSSSNGRLYVNGEETFADIETMYEPFNETSQIDILFMTYLYGESFKFNYTVGNYSTGMTSLILKLTKMSHVIKFNLVPALFCLYFVKVPGNSNIVKTMSIAEQKAFLTTVIQNTKIRD